MRSACAKVRAIKYSEELGNYSNVAKHIRLHSGSIMSSADADARADYLSVLERAKPSFDYERIHGVGSLLKLEAPLNQKLISSGLITAQQVDAALRHRARQSAFTPAVQKMELGEVLLQE